MFKIQLYIFFYLFSLMLSVPAQGEDLSTFINGVRKEDTFFRINYADYKSRSTLFPKHINIYPQVESLLKDENNSNSNDSIVIVESGLKTSISNTLSLLWSLQFNTDKENTYEAEKKDTQLLTSLVYSF